MLMDEHALVVERLNAAEVTQAQLVRLAISASLSKDGFKLWKKQVEALDAATKARERQDDGGQAG